MTRRAGLRRRPRGGARSGAPPRSAGEAIGGPFPSRRIWCTPSTSCTAVRAAQGTANGRERHLWPITRQSAGRQVSSLMHAAGIVGPQACPRGLRHSYGIAAIAAGVPVTTIACSVTPRSAPERANSSVSSIPPNSRTRMSWMGTASPAQRLPPPGGGMSASDVDTGPFARHPVRPLALCGVVEAPIGFGLLSRPEAKGGLSSISSDVWVGSSI